MIASLTTLNKPAPISPSPPGDLAELQSLLAYAFSDLSLLQEALTHASAKGSRRGARINERLEFLGDRVLGLLAAETLFQSFPEESEGKLAPRLNALVRKERCAEVARTIGLDRFIDLSGAQGMRRSAMPAAVLGDACEALIGALYLDGGLGAARAFFDAHWSLALEMVEDLPRDAKSALQEFLQGRGGEPPVYEVVGRYGPDHAPEFEVGVRMGTDIAVTARGGSRRRAEQAAAAALLVKLGVWGEDDLAREEQTGSLR